MATKKDKKNVIYVSEQGLKKLEDELKYLKEVKRLEIAEKLKEAISYGDLSENSEYEDARNEQGQVEIKIKELEEKLKNVEIVSEDDIDDSNKVVIGKEVKIQNIATLENYTYKIVGTTESNILDDMPRISNESPVGKALLGRKQGDIIEVKSRSGVIEYKIVSIS